MCKMTDLGARWKRQLELPPFGASRLWWAVRYNEETRYVLAPPPWDEREMRKWLKPLYAIRVRARDI